MATKKKYLYKVDTTRKIIFIDDAATPTEAERLDKVDYLAAGYKIHHKSAVKAEQARKRAKETGFGKKAK